MAPKSSTPVRLYSDVPATDPLLFKFEAYADTLSGLIANKENATPFVMGIYGSRGTGKTTLLKAIKTRLDAEHLTDPERYRRCKTVWFQAWKFDHEEKILAPLMASICKAMAADGFFTLARGRIDALSKRIDKSRVFSSISSLLAGADISEFFFDLADKEKLGFYDTFQKFFDDLVWTFLNWRFKITGQEKPDDKKGAVVIFIDDLDLCSPSSIVNILEAIKLFMDRCGFVFILAADPGTIENALLHAKGLRPEEAKDFMGKIVQAGFSLPAAIEEDFVHFMEAHNGDYRLFEPYLVYVSRALNHNPRRMKQFVNQCLLLNGLMRNAYDGIGLEMIVAWSTINVVSADLAALAEEKPETFFALQNQIKQLKAKIKEVPPWELSERQFEQEGVPQTFHPFISQQPLCDLIERFDVTPDDLGRLLALSAFADRSIL